MFKQLALKIVFIETLENQDVHPSWMWVLVQMSPVTFLESGFSSPSVKTHAQLKDKQEGTNSEGQHPPLYLSPFLAPCCPEK